MKINFITRGDKEKRGSTRIRVLNIMNALNKTGDVCALNDKKIKGYDVLVFQKTLLRDRIKHKIREARRFDVPIVLDLDDYVEVLMPQLKYFDIITVSTEYLKKLCDPYHPNVKVVPNMVDVDDLSIILKKTNNHKKVVWYGYSQNSYILEKWGIKDVTKISDRNYDILYDADKIDEQLKKFDLVVIPQEQNNATLVKTHCRMLKALYLGIPCLVSDIPEYLNLAKELDFPKEFIVSDYTEWNKKIADFKSGKLKFDFDFVTARQKILEIYGPDTIAAIFKNSLKVAVKHKPCPLAVLSHNIAVTPISVVLMMDTPQNTLKSLSNLLSQTWLDFEIIIWGKEIPQAIIDFAKKDPRIHLNNPALGQYVYFLNAGDTIEQNCLKRLYTAAYMSDADITMMQGYIDADGEKAIIPDDKCVTKIKNMSEVLEFLDYPLIFGTCLYKNDFLHKKGIWHPKFHILPDADFAYLSWKKCGSLYVIPEKLLTVTKHNFNNFIDVNKTTATLLGNYAKATYDVLPPTDKHEVLMVVASPEESVPALVTLNSIIDKCAEQLLIKVFFTFAISPEIKSEFTKLSDCNHTVLINEIAKHKKEQNELIILFDILLHSKNDSQVLYVSNLCITQSDFSDIFALPKDRSLYIGFNTETSTLDTNIMLFNVGILKKDFSRYLANKQLTPDDYYRFVWQYAGIIPKCYHYSADNYKNFSLDFLPKVIFLCYEKRKPWEKLGIPFGFLWWQYARNSIFYEQLLKNVSLPASGTNNISKISMLKSIDKNSDETYALMKEYVKEAILYIFTFGKTAQQHKDNLYSISKKILSKAAK